mmetsp:Transcript_30564/g.87319  ORF Transcript_30564/g.87319 Transcript_30564/m.87319 type:complete len:259 (+) Transcript_30564:88-864(+)
MAGCSFKKACICYCACSCCVLLAIILFVVIVAASFETPEVEVTKAQMSGLTVNATAVTMFVNISIHVKNPNRWPIEGSVDELLAKIYSLDAQAADERGDAVYMGDATLPAPVSIETESETDFVVTASLMIRSSPETAAVVARMNRDCGASSQVAGSATTKLEVVLAGILAKVAGAEVDWRGKEIPFSTMVPCQGDASAAGSAAGGLTTIPPGIAATVPTAAPTAAPTATIAATATTVAPPAMTAAATTVATTLLPPLR